MSNQNYYLRGKQLLNKPVIARKYFEQSLKFSRNRLKALLQIISLDLKEGDFQNARRMIQKYEKEFQDSFRFNLLRSYLEHDEYNFKREESLLYPFLNTNNYNDCLKCLGDIDIQYQRYDEAFDRFYQLLGEKLYTTKAIFKLVSIKILEGYYKDAEKILYALDIKELNKRDKKTYNYLKQYIKFFLGELNYKNIINLEHNYKISRLFDQNNIELVKHLEKHKNSRQFHNDGCFLSMIDFHSLIDEVEKRIENLTPIHHISGDKYIFRMPRVIGIKGNTEMRDLCVVTILSTKTIITMYPIILSKQFDQEKNSHILLPKN